MNKKALIVVIVLALIAAILAYLKMKPSSPAPQNQTVGNAMSEAAQFAAAIASGQPTTCTLTKGTDVMKYHLKGKLMAADITSTVEGQSSVSHMINDGSYLYMWSDGQTQGSKISLTQPSPSAADSTSSVPQFEGESDYQNLESQGYTIDCQATALADSVFTPPTDIKFVDPSAMMQEIKSPDGSGIDMSKLQELQKQYGGGEQTPE